MRERLNEKPVPLPGDKRKAGVLYGLRGVNYSSTMIALPPVDGREGGVLVSCGEKRAEKPAEIAALFQAMGSGTTT